MLGSLLVVRSQWLPQKLDPFEEVPRTKVVASRTQPQAERMAPTRAIGPWRAWRGLWQAQISI